MNFRKLAWKNLAHRPVRTLLTAGGVALAVAVAVSLGGRSAAALEVDPRDFAVYRIAIPPEVLAPGEPLEVAFDLPDARSSAGDPRVLGIAVQTVKILKLAGASAAAGAAPAASAP